MEIQCFTWYMTILIMYVALGSLVDIHTISWNPLLRNCLQIIWEFQVEFWLWFGTLGDDTSRH